MHIDFTQAANKFNQIYTKIVNQTKSLPESQQVNVAELTNRISQIVEPLIKLEHPIPQHIVNASLKAKKELEDNFKQIEALYLQVYSHEKEEKIQELKTDYEHLNVQLKILEHLDILFCELPQDEEPTKLSLEAVKSLAFLASKNDENALNYLDKFLPTFFSTQQFITSLLINELLHLKSLSSLFLFFDSFKNEPVKKNFFDFCLNYHDTILIMDQVVDYTLERQAPWSILFLYEILTFLTGSVNHTHFVKKLFKRAAEEPKLLNLMIAYSTQLEDETILKKNITHAFKISKLPYLPINRQYYLDSLESYFHFLGTRKIDGTLDVYTWKNYKLETRLCSTLLRIESDQLLIQALTAPQTLEYTNFPFKPTSSLFPITRELLVSQESKVEEVSVELLNKLHEKSGIKSSILTHKAHESNRSQEHTRLALGEEPLSIWLRDICVTAQNTQRETNHFLIPRVSDYTELDEDKHLSLLESRVRYSCSNPDKFIPTQIGLGGRIATYGEQAAFLDYLVHQVKSTDQINQSPLFFEGGNIRIGLDENNNPYALCGSFIPDMNQDFLINDFLRLGLSRSDDEQYHLIDAELLHQQPESPDHSPNHDEIRSLMGLSLGIHPSQVYFVEQGKFHIDMCLSIGHNKKILVNQVSEALQIQLEERRAKGPISELEKMKIAKVESHARKLIHYENKLEKDLKKYGFNVVRIPGAFPSLNPQETSSKSLDFEDEYNFFNHISMRANPKLPEDKELRVIALGGPDTYQRAFKDFFTQLLPDTTPKENIQFDFLDPQKSTELLKRGGGLCCITQTLPNPF